MRFEHLLDKRIIVARRAKIVGTDKFLATTVTSAAMHLQPLTDEATSLIEGVYGKAFVLYCDGSIDVQEGDKLRHGTDYYIVRSAGATRRDYGSFDYKKIVVEKQ